MGYLQNLKVSPLITCKLPGGNSGFTWRHNLNQMIRDNKCHMPIWWAETVHQFCVTLPKMHNCNLIMRKHCTYSRWGAIYKRTWPRLLTFVKVTKDKKPPCKYHWWEKMWQLSAKWGPRLDPRTESGWAERAGAPGWSPQTDQRTQQYSLSGLSSCAVLWELGEGQKGTLHYLCNFKSEIISKFKKKS